MGRIATKLRETLRSTGRTRHEVALDSVPADIQSPDDLEAEGHSPLFARYVAAQQLASVYAENAGHLPELAPFSDAVIAAEDEYMPGGPPMSPLTESYFWLWAIFDLRFGPDRETMGDLILAATVESGLPDGPLVETLTLLARSRMGVFIVEEHPLADPDAPEVGGLVRLREFVTGDRVVAEVSSGHRGEPGELWYARVCPPIPGVADHGLVMTTPYVLRGTSRADWSLYLRRALASHAATLEATPAAGTTAPPPGDDAARKRHLLHDFLKYGPTAHHWHEYVMLGYDGYTREAIFLSGIPDIPATLPHA